ncbi:SDR family NAD(P)-dependent oxidoreductase [Parasphingorhabdus sp.]|jgi:NAD(P)-dependent dehydrogenase (short-subunit alcohol dehydrogenase family)|uniref:SDR family NAD(P)-dependent oxidoreductase n=1 Tax=Parasphingorhabdus sp. TaxID=2709688 RepID=UPI003D26D36D
MGRLEGKKAVILGAAGQDNMGQVIAKRFRDEGADVLVSGRKEEELKRFAKEIGGHYALCDLTVEQDVEALASAAKDKMGGVDIAINATGVGFLKPFLDNTREELEMMSALQLVGPFQFYQAMINAMSDNSPSGGSIIQISSATATVMLNDHAAYMGTKAATDHIIRCVAHEFGERGIRANSISPGLTRTPMTAGVDQVPGLVESFEARYPLGRIGTSEDIAAAAVFLASDECFMTGENLQVNGGLCLRGNPTRKDQELMMGAIAAAS